MVFIISAQGKISYHALYNNDMSTGHSSIDHCEFHLEIFQGDKYD